MIILFIINPGLNSGLDFYSILNYLFTQEWSEQTEADWRLQPSKYFSSFQPCLSGRQVVWNQTTSDSGLILKRIRQNDCSL